MITINTNAGAKYFSSQMSLQNWYLWKVPEISKCLKVLPQQDISYIGF